MSFYITPEMRSFVTDAILKYHQRVKDQEQKEKDRVEQKRLEICNYFRDKGIPLCAQGSIFYIGALEFTVNQEADGTYFLKPLDYYRRKIYDIADCGEYFIWKEAEEEKQKEKRQKEVDNGKLPW